MDTVYDGRFCKEFNIVISVDDQKRFVEDNVACVGGTMVISIRRLTSVVACCHFNRI